MSGRRANESWEGLADRVVACRKCPRLVRHRERVAREKRRQYRHWEYWGRPVTGFGDRRAEILVVGLAPAAHGANRTGRVFTGDRSGDWLYDALNAAGFANQARSTDRFDGLRLDNAYVSAIVRCAPPDNRPTPAEVERCRPFLVAELEKLARLRVVVTLGELALKGFLKAWEDVERPVPSPRPRFRHGAHYALAGGGVTLLVSYHPSQQNTFTGRLTRRMFRGVFREAARGLGRAPGRGPSLRRDRG